MNSFEMDIKRAFTSFGFFAGIVVGIVILFLAEQNEQIFYVSVPVICTFPYSTAWIRDYQGGFLKLYLIRGTVSGYILGKILACGISGGFVEVSASYLYTIWREQNPGTGQIVSVDFLLLFLSGMFWAMVAATLAAITNSSYVAYGGSFVVYYILVILYERYFKDVYCLYPYEWIQYKHTWIFEKNGIVMLLSLMMIVVVMIYYELLRRCIKNV